VAPFVIVFPSGIDGLTVMLQLLGVDMFENRNQVCGMHSR